MALTFIARMKVHADKEDAFIRHCQALEDAVREHEPDCLLYKFYKLEEPLHFAVVESFASAEAEEAHRQTAHFKALAPALIACLDGPYVREYLYDLDGAR
ncbi:MAG: antibiotic biosynthesis monooxygenase [Alphaproteobacteria bacterium]|nr:MAG: antibiotic biosynthesis monooxygenase [Alphaproteobacteria bacterium]